MTTTPAKIEANQRNARFSTGPRSPAGKEIAARNALRHGMRAEKYLVPGEEEQFENILQDLRDYYEPATALEERAVVSIARCHLRLDRVAQGEAEVIADAPLEQFFGREQQIARTLLHYETVIRKTLSLEVEALARLQARRKSTKTGESRGQVGRDTNIPTRGSHAVAHAPATPAIVSANIPPSSASSAISASLSANDSTPNVTSQAAASAATNEPKKPESTNKADTRIEPRATRHLVPSDSPHFTNEPIPNEPKFNLSLINRAVTRSSLGKTRFRPPAGLASPLFAQPARKPKAPFR